MPKYREIAEDIRHRITAGEFHLGGRLDTIAELCAYYDGAALNTVRAALRILADEGILKIEPGIGTTVLRVPEDDMPARMLTRLRAMRAELDGMIAELEEGGKA